MANTDPVDHVWALLAARRGVWRTPVLATVSSEGADARTIVLRDVNVRTRCLRFYTDRKSPKIAQLAEYPNVCALVYDRERDLQARFYGQVRPLTSPADIEDCWHSLNSAQREIYFSQADFMVYEIEIQRVNCLMLSTQGNQEWTCHWLGDEWDCVEKPS